MRTQQPRKSETTISYCFLFSRFVQDIGECFQLSTMQLAITMHLHIFKITNLSLTTYTKWISGRVSQDFVGGSGFGFSSCLPFWPSREGRSQSSRILIHLSSTHMQTKLVLQNGDSCRSQRWIVGLFEYNKILCAKFLFWSRVLSISEFLAEL